MVSLKLNFAAKLLITTLLSVFALQANAKTALMTYDLWGRANDYQEEQDFGWGSRGLALKCNYPNDGKGYMHEKFSFTSSTVMKIWSDGTASITGDIKRIGTDETWGLNVSLWDPEIRKFSNPDTYYVDHDGHTTNGSGSEYMGDGDHVTQSRIMSILNGENTIWNGDPDPYGLGTGHSFLAWDKLSLDLIDINNYGDSSDLADRVKLTGWDGKFAKNSHNVAAVDYGYGFSSDFWVQNSGSGCYRNGKYYCVGDHKGKDHPPRVPLPTTAALFGLGLLALGRKKLLAN